MRRLLPFMLLIALLRVLPAGAQAPTLAPAAGDTPLYAHTYALLIGINDYQHVKKLEYAVNDATALRDVLVNLYGFPAENVVTLLDGQATREGIISALAQVTSKQRVGEDDRILIFFSGHGQTVPTRNGGAKGFLIPADAAIRLDDNTDPAPYLTTCVSMNTVWETLDLCPAKHVLLIADACYSGLLAKTRGELGDPLTSGALAKLAHLPARQVITAGAASERVKEDPAWGHGALTMKLLENLRADAAVPGQVITAGDLFADVKRGVMHLTDGRQVPQLADKDTEGEFLFIVPDNKPPHTPPAVAPAANLPSPAPASAPAEEIPIAPPANTADENIPIAPPANAPAENEAASDSALLQVTSDPPGADVYLLGKVCAVTPCTQPFALDEAIEQVTFGFRLKGYRDVVRTVTLQRGECTTISVTLEKSTSIRIKTRSDEELSHLQPAPPPALRSRPVSAPIPQVTQQIGPEYMLPTRHQRRAALEALFASASASTQGPFRPYSQMQMHLASKAAGGGASARSQQRRRH